MSASGITGTAQYLTFTLGEEVFALEILKVLEVLEYDKVTRVPGTPTFMQGVINLRGSVVPVVDLRLKFGMPATEPTINTCIVIMEVEIEGVRIVLGTLTDSVQEVVEMDADQIEPPPSLGTRVESNYIRGMGKRNDEFVIILDVDQVFSGKEMAIVREAADEPKRGDDGREAAGGDDDR